MIDLLKLAGTWFSNKLCWNINKQIALNLLKFHLKGESILMDFCISCGSELCKYERNRSECWECMDTTTEAYTEEE
jgi:hypothetical protein